MHLRGFVLFALNMLAFGLDTSAHEAKEGFVPGGLRAGALRRTGPATDALQRALFLREASDRVVPSFRFGPRRAGVIVSAEDKAPPTATPAPDDTPTPTPTTSTPKAPTTTSTGKTLA